MRYFSIPAGERPTVTEMALMTLVEREGRIIRSYRVRDDKTNEVIIRKYYHIKPD